MSVVRALKMPVAFSIPAYAPERARPAQLGIGLRAMPAQMKPKARCHRRPQRRANSFAGRQTKQLALQDGAQNRGQDGRQHGVHGCRAEHHDGIYAEHGQWLKMRNGNAHDHGERVTGDDGG